MANTEALQALRIIDDQIAELQKARNQVAKAFGIEAAPPTVSIRNSDKTVAPVRPATSAANGNGHQPTGRKVELARFLLANGPAARTAIVEKSGLPEGTVSYCLADKRFFEQGADGNWNINAYSRRGLERGFRNEAQEIAAEHN